MAPVTVVLEKPHRHTDRTADDYEGRVEMETFREIEARFSSPRIGDLGCGRRKFPGALGVDFVPASTVDLAWDLDRFPWPLLDGSFHLLIASHIMEHVRDFGGFLAESYRILAPEGVLVVRCPHFSCRESYRNPTHVRHLTYDAMQEMLIEGHEGYRHDLSCTLIPFHLAHTQLTFRGRTRGRIGRFLARRKIRKWEQYWSRIFPAREICWVLRKAVP